MPTNREDEDNARDAGKHYNNGQTAGNHPVPANIVQHVATKYIAHHTHGKYAASEHQKPMPTTRMFQQFMNENHNTESLRKTMPAIPQTVFTVQC